MLRFSQNQELQHNQVARWKILGFGIRFGAATLYVQNKQLSEHFAHLI